MAMNMEETVKETSDHDEEMPEEDEHVEPMSDIVTMMSGDGAPAAQTAGDADSDPDRQSDRHNIGRQQQVFAEIIEEEIIEEETVEVRIVIN